jgi:sec-independent protein translocase protein TatA
MNTLGFIQNIGATELIILLAIALLLFGKRLPEVGKSLGKGIIEFKKGLKGIDEDIEEQSSRPSAPPKQELPPSPPPYRAPVNEAGEDRRVSRADAVEEPAQESRPN